MDHRRSLFAHSEFDNSCFKYQAMDLSAYARNLLIEGLERENALIAQVVELRRELEISHIVSDGANSAIDMMHRHTERLEAELERLKADVQQRQDRIDCLEAIPKPPAALPGITLAALGIVLKQHRSLEIDRLQAVIAERDNEIRRLRSAAGMDTDESGDEI